jgi:hypothetical protein
VSPKKREPRVIKMAEIAAQFELASYWFGEKWCPAVHRKTGGGYGIRIVKSMTRVGLNRSVTYDYFEVDADGTIDTAPRGYAREFKPGRVVDIESEAERAATPDPDAERITFGGGPVTAQTQPNAELAYRNPYWDTLADFARYEAYHPWDKGLFVGGYARDEDRNLNLRRRDLTSDYAWTITAPATVAFVAEHCGPRVIDPLAGSGYWAWLLAQHGADVAASDLNPPNVAANNWHRGGVWTTVAARDAVEAVRGSAGRTLLLSWPPYDDPTGAKVIEAYAGDRIVYIGEGDSGCCGGDDMWELLRSGWHEVAEHRPVQWYGLHDWVTVYERGPRPDGGEGGSTAGDPA